MMFSSGDYGLHELDGIFLNKAIVTYNGVDPVGGFKPGGLSHNGSGITRGNEDEIRTRQCSNYSGFLSSSYFLLFAEK